MKNAVIYDMPEHVYRAAPGVSQSSLKAIARSPAHYKAGVEDDDKEDTAATLMGRLVGTLVLEPKREPWWCVKPEGVKLNETDGKDWAKEFLKWNEEVDGKFPRSPKDAFEKKNVTLIPYDDFLTAGRMASALHDSKKPEVRDMLDGAKCEVSVFANATTPSGDVLCKCRPDIVPAGNVICDLKTCPDARPAAFTQSIRKWGYDVQAASYLKNWNIAAPNDQKEIFLLLAIEKSAPHACIVHRLDTDFMQRGLDQYEQMLATYAYCTAMSDWPDYPPGINTISLPHYDRNQIE